VVVNWLSSWLLQSLSVFHLFLFSHFVADFLFPHSIGKGVITLCDYLPLEKTHIHKS
jgi:hypothetical protein